MKKILITSTELMMIQFLVPHAKNLTENGFHVEIACSEVGGRMDEVRAALDGTVKAIHTLRLERSPTSPRNLLGCRDMKRLLKENRYDIIWTNEPVMGVVTRLAVFSVCVLLDAFWQRLFRLLSIDRTAERLSDWAEQKIRTFLKD